MFFLLQVLASLVKKIFVRISSSVLLFDCSRFLNSSRMSQMNTIRFLNKI